MDGTSGKIKIKPQYAKKHTFLIRKDRKDVFLLKVE